MSHPEIIVFALPGNEMLANILILNNAAKEGEFTVRKFPDKETYVQIHSDVKDKKVIIVCSLDRPDEKLLPLYFLCKTAIELGAKCTCLITPYLAYMRQDATFKPGEGVTSKYFASLISSFSETITTVDPHLHRYDSLNEIYSIPATVVQSANHISDWIKSNVQNPLLIGPDSESEQWVSEIARNANAPYLVLQKLRHGDHDVEVSVPDIEIYINHTPVLVDDIISTAKTMIETVGHLLKSGMKPPVCIGIHAVFSDNAYQDLIDAGVESIVTCNTIAHKSNEIDISTLFSHLFRNR